MTEVMLRYFAGEKQGGLLLVGIGALALLAAAVLFAPRWELRPLAWTLGVMAVLEVMAGRLTVGDFVLLVTFLMQIYRPLNFIGFVYREIRQGLTDIEEMFKLLDLPAELPELCAKFFEGSITFRLIGANVLYVTRS